MGTLGPVPSAFRRGLLALGLLAVFYAATGVIGLALVATGPLILYFHIKGVPPLITFAFTTVPGLVVLRALFVRPPRFVAPGPRLTEAEAPELFAALARLAAQAGTRAPDEVYLTPLLSIGVTERGGILGFGSRRVLIIGVAAFAVLDVGELESVLAHELGHYLGGETRLGGVFSYTTAFFRSVLLAGQRASSGRDFVALGIEVARSLSSRLGVTYARIYFGIMRPIGRRLELAADALSVRIAGRETAARALTKIVLSQETWRRYLESEVVPLLEHRVLPLDLLAGFEAHESRLRDRGALEALRIELDHETTEPFDTHPSLSERVAFIGSHEEGRAIDADRRRAAVLLANAGDLPRRAFEVVRHLSDQPNAVTGMPWADVAARVLEPESVRAAAVVVAMLYPGSAAGSARAFADLVGGLSRGDGLELARRMHPDLRLLAPREQALILPLVMEGLLGQLFVGALLERGGRIALERGDPERLVDYGGKRIAPFALARAAMKDDAVVVLLHEWAQRLVA